MAAIDRTTMTVEIPVTFRIATKADLPKLEWYGQYSHFRNLFLRAYRDQLRGHRIMLLADCNGFPIGHVFILLKSNNRTGIDRKPRAYLYSLRVMEIFQGRGIGTRLLEEAEDMIREHGLQWVTIAVAKDNYNARRLYERLGYRISAEDEGSWSYVDHRGRTQYVNEPCWILEKRI